MYRDALRHVYLVVATIAVSGTVVLSLVIGSAPDDRDFLKTVQLLGFSELIPGTVPLSKPSSKPAAPQ